MGFYIGSWFIPYYGLMITVGVTLAVIMGLWLVKRANLNVFDFILIVTYAGGSGMVGAKLFYWIVSFREIDWFLFFHDLNYFNVLMSSGFVFYGGLICGIAILPLIAKLHRISVWRYVRICIPCIPFVHAFGRIGCHLAGCCYGIEYGGLFSIQYHHSSIAPNGVDLFPVQMTEAMMEFLICCILLIMVLKGSHCATELYLCLYSVGRFVLEFFRGDVERGFLGILATSQWISIAVLIATVCVFIVRKSRFVSST